ncbi:sulfotransferase domain-containing protein [Krasilnikovia cinnamomea]|uniref:Sulfotransferase domain-containing protein n=1 Tax=Krasilnikovia cinnamomea TaxID=349313 RepID=A0A4Q7ZLH6_9ACTN|nr:sulfotransferase [Krasilnikovia cinnamomea]RZU51810.1 sulfotransferase domain-containing protein [Krasilnikovia cinnamomea]
MPLPDFLIAGVPKAGTTALHAALERHPQLYLSRPKEPKFFLTDGPPPRIGGPGDKQTYQEHIWRQEDYERLFVPAPRGTLRGEATPFYLYDPATHLRIHALVPDVRIILMLRDPVDRAHSNWTHLWIAGLEPEADFVTACRLEEQRRAAGWADFWHYIGLGRYGEQVRHLFEVFDREQVLLLRYRDLREQPAATLDQVCAFLGVRTGLLTEVPRENVNRHVVEDTRFNAALRGLLRFGGNVGHVFPLPVRKSFRGPLLTVLHRRKGRRPRPTRQERAALLPYFADDLALLQDVTGRSYADWLSLDPAQSQAGTSRP